MSRDNENQDKSTKERGLVVRAEVLKMPSPSEFFEEYTLCGVKTWDEIHVLGQNNVQDLIANARGQEKAATHQIDQLQNRKGLLIAALKWLALNPEKTAGDYFAELAQNYDNPQFAPDQIGKRPGAWGDQLEPLTADSESRKGGSTTFNLCGWCSKAGGGSCRYNYHISTTCELLETFEYPISGEEIQNYTKFGSPLYVSRELQFNTPCLMQKLNKEQCQGILNGIHFNIGVYIAQRESVRAVINKLLEQRRLTQGVIKPWISGNRPAEYMNVGDPMVVYIGEWGKDCIVKGDWINAIGIFGYRHHDGCMSYQAHFPIHTNASYYEGRGGGAGMGRPEALIATEFAFFVSTVQKLGPKATYIGLMKSTGYKNGDEAFLRIWFKNVERQKLEGFDCKKFFEALKSPNFAQPPKGWAPPTEEIKIETVKDAQSVLQCLDVNLFKTTDEIKSWANMQLQFVHPDKHQKSSPDVQAYAARQTKAVLAARDFLLNLRVSS